MFRPSVRRLTAVLALAAILCLAAPAAAAPAHCGVPVAFGLFDQFLAWLGHLWSGEPAEKTVTPASSSEDAEASQTQLPENEHDASLDPNG
jgi:hypothetical protein